MKLYPYQSDNKTQIYGAWALGIRNVLAVLPTGAGKTVIFSSILADQTSHSVVIAHRKEILGQIAMTLAVNGIKHSVTAVEKDIHGFRGQQREVTGRSWIDPRASVIVASVDTLLARISTLKKWGETIGLWVQDEAHHVQDINKWGRVLELFPNARGLGVTATAGRGDGKSLKRNRGGVFDVLINGPQPRWLIKNKYLSDYRIFVPHGSIDVSQVKITGSGEFNQKQLTAVVHDSQIVGDIVRDYRKFAAGQRGVTFVTDVQTAQETAEAFRCAGIPAAALSAKSTGLERFDTIRKFKSGEIKQLVNVDLFGEGFDLPEIAVISDAAPTAVLGRYRQRFGRVLRRAEGKTHGKYIDHVGNLKRHGLPDTPVIWSLDAGVKSTVDKRGPPLRVCIECFRVWESYSRRCPHCDHLPAIEDRSGPECVEGDLTELSPEVLEAMRNEAERLINPADTSGMEYVGAPQVAIYGLKARHRERQVAQSELRDKIALWGGGAKFKGLSESERYMKFYREFEIDVLSAQVLGRRESEELTGRIDESLKQFEGE